MIMVIVMVSVVMVKNNHENVDEDHRAHVFVKNSWDDDNHDDNDDNVDYYDMIIIKEATIMVICINNHIL